MGSRVKEFLGTWGQAARSGTEVVRVHDTPPFSCPTEGERREDASGENDCKGNESGVKIVWSNWPGMTAEKIAAVLADIVIEEQGTDGTIIRTRIRTRNTKSRKRREHDQPEAP